MDDKINTILGEYGHSSHDLRHTRLTDLSNEGMSLVMLQNFAGHADPKTTSKYVNLSNEDILMKVREIDTRIKCFGGVIPDLERPREQKAATKVEAALGKRIAPEALNKTESFTPIHSFRESRKRTTLHYH